MPDLATKPDLKELLSNREVCADVSAAEQAQCLEEACAEVEIITGTPWEKTRVTEILLGDGTNRLQIEALCVRCVLSVYMRESKDDQWSEVPGCRIDHLGGLYSSSASCCEGGGWPIGCEVKVTFEAGLEGKCCRMAAGIILALAERKAIKCRAGKKTESMGDYSVTYFADVADGLTDREKELLRSCC